MLSSITYDVEFPDGMTIEYLAYLTDENILTLINKDGYIEPRSEEATEDDKRMMVTYQVG